MTRNGQMVMMGDTMEVLYAIEMLIAEGNILEAQAYANQARTAITQMAHGWVRADAAYSVLAKSLKILPEELARERSNDDTEPS